MYLCKKNIHTQAQLWLLCGGPQIRCQIKFRFCSASSIYLMDVEMLKCPRRLGKSLRQKEIKTCQKLLSPEVSQNLNSFPRISAIQQNSRIRNFLCFFVRNMGVFFVLNIIGTWLSWSDPEFSYPLHSEYKMNTSLKCI